MTNGLFDLTQTIAILLVGYSLFAAVHIAVVNLFQGYYRSHRFEQLMGFGLLSALVGLQLIHFAYLQHRLILIHDLPYRILLYSVAPTFYLFSKPLLFAEKHHRFSWGLHFIPVLSTPFLPSSWAISSAFVLGSGYLLWLAHGVYALRNQRSRFKLELWILTAVFVIAVGASLLGLGVLSVPEQWFVALYSIAIGSALLLVNIALSNSPQLATEIVDAARETYAVSTLKQVDCNDRLRQLTLLMEDERIFQDPDLDLPTVAAQLNLSGHQLSELINVHIGKSFSRYVREYRVNSAKQILLAEPSASVLSVGLSVGFTSQSNFYSAFREIVGSTPGQFRKINLTK